MIETLPDTAVITAPEHPHALDTAEALRTVCYTSRRSPFDASGESVTITHDGFWFRVEAVGGTVDYDALSDLLTHYPPPEPSVPIIAKLLRLYANAKAPVEFPGGVAMPA